VFSPCPRQRDRPATEEHTSPSLAHEHDCDEEGVKADDGLDPKHSLMAEKLTDPTKDGRFQGLAEEDATRVDGHGKSVLFSEKRVGDCAAHMQCAN
jgi:hypothetical protein